jgi:arylsulfatase A-like enzyme
MVDTSGEKMLIEAVYEWSDKALGRLMELASDSTIVCVLSDHGFGFKLPGQYSYDMNKLLSRLGLVAFDQTGGRVDLSRSSLFDCRVSTGIVNMVKKMQVVVNGKDTYNNEAERQLFLERGEELRNMLESLKTVRGENFFGKLDLVDEGDRVIITGMVKIGFLNQQVLVGGKAVPAEEFLTESDISGWHRNDGVFIISGPGIKHCRIERCSELDVAPTLLHILGLPVPLDMDGQVLKKVFAQRKLRNVEYCESYGIPAPSSAGFDLPEMGESVKDAIKEQLQALGYTQ